MSRLNRSIGFRVAFNSLPATLDSSPGFALADLPIGMPAASVRPTLSPLDNVVAFRGLAWIVLGHRIPDRHNHALYGCGVRHDELFNVGALNAAGYWLRSLGLRRWSIGSDWRRVGACLAVLCPADDTPLDPPASIVWIAGEMVAQQFRLECFEIGCLVYEREQPQCLWLDPFLKLDQSLL
jgi:hypothetical protein